MQVLLQQASWTVLQGCTNWLLAVHAAQQLATDATVALDFLAALSRHPRACGGVAQELDREKHPHFAGVRHVGKRKSAGGGGGGGGVAAAAAAAAELSAKPQLIAFDAGKVVEMLKLMQVEADLQTRFEWQAKRNHDLLLLLAENHTALEAAAQWLRSPKRSPELVHLFYLLYPAHMHSAQRISLGDDHSRSRLDATLRRAANQMMSAATAESAANLCASIASDHPAIVERMLPMLATVLEARASHSTQQLLEHRVPDLYMHALSLLDTVGVRRMLGAASFESLSRVLGSLLQVLFMAANDPSTQEQFRPVVSAVGALLSQIADAAPRQFVRLLQPFESVLMGIAEVYPLENGPLHSVLMSLQRDGQLLVLAPTATAAVAPYALSHEWMNRLLCLLERPSLSLLELDPMLAELEAKSRLNACGPGILAQLCAPLCDLVSAPVVPLAMRIVVIKLVLRYFEWNPSAHSAKSIVAGFVELVKHTGFTQDASLVEDVARLVPRMHSLARDDAQLIVDTLLKSSCPMLRDTALNILSN